MMNRRTFLGATATAATLATIGCDRGAKPAGAGTSATAPAASKKKLYWVQMIKGHPVHQLTQIAFREGCASVGMDCEIVGTDGNDVAASTSQIEQVIAKGDAAGMAVWAMNPAYKPAIAKLGRAGLPVVVPHFPGLPDKFPGAKGVIGCDPQAYAAAAADAIGAQAGGKGTVAITQGSFNILENEVAAAFKARMNDKFPGMKLLPPQEEGFDPNKSIASAVAILQANPDLVAAMSTTGGGPTAWAGAQREAKRQIVAIGMDYTRVNLDLVKSGAVYAIIAQPLWEESFGAAELLAKLSRGESVEWWTKKDAPLVTKDKLEPYYALLQKVDAATRG